jgi:hypothetical protein
VDGREDAEHLGEEFLVEGRVGVGEVLHDAGGAGGADDVGMDFGIRHRELEREFTEIGATGVAESGGLSAGGA